jgi:hypothetical protein
MSFHHSNGSLSAGTMLAIDGVDSARISLLGRIHGEGIVQ